jgi:hypothetical protein
MAGMRDTDYAKEIATVRIADPSGSGHESRMERLFIKAKGEEEIRFSWWTNGFMQARPLDLPENELAQLVGEGIAKGVLSPSFLTKVNEVLAGRKI